MTINKLCFHDEAVDYDWLMTTFDRNYEYFQISSNDVLLKLARGNNLVQQEQEAFFLLVRSLTFVLEHLRVSPDSYFAIRIFETYR